MKETYIPKSTRIDQVEYDSDEQKMTVTFKDGRSYEYTSVPQSMFLGIQNAASAGSYFGRNIQGRYNDTEI